MTTGVQETVLAAVDGRHNVIFVTLLLGVSSLVLRLRVKLLIVVDSPLVNLSVPADSDNMRVLETLLIWLGGIADAHERRDLGINLGLLLLILGVQLLRFIG